MKKLLFTFWAVLALGQLSAFCQTTESLISKCMENAGSDAKYIKDYMIILGESDGGGELRYKAKISLWKDMKYRFTMCTTADSPEQMILNLDNDDNKLVLTSFDSKSGKVYSTVDFICNQSGIYQISFDFTGTKKGSGVGVVSLVK